MFEEDEDDEMEDDDIDFQEIVIVNEITEIKQIQSNFKIQGLRSGSQWSIGLPMNQPEKSIQNAYISLIQNSEHFVYIENQFFISSTAGDLVENQIVQTIVERIKKAIEEDQNYIVYIVLPLLPGFGGNITKKDGQLLRIQIEWHLNTIYKSENSLIKQVMKYNNDWRKYIKIFGLRNHAVMDGIPKSEIVYVHSKLIIVDDKYALLGSANINDRSMLGKRDSELAVIIEQNNKEEGLLNDQKVQKSPKVKDFRIEAWKSIFGIDEFEGKEVSYEDPLNKDFINAIETQSKFNEEFYWKVFGFYPHNSLTTLNEIEDMQDNFVMNEDYYFDNKDKVQGFAQPWPVFFLENEQNLTSKFLDIGSTLLPQIIYTQFLLILILTLFNQFYND